MYNINVKKLVSLAAIQLTSFKKLSVFNPTPQRKGVKFNHTRYFPLGYWYVWLSYVIYVHLICLTKIQKNSHF